MRSFTTNYYGDQTMQNAVGGAYSTHGKMRNDYNILGRKPERMRACAKLRSKWEDNIKMNVKRFGARSRTGVKWFMTMSIKGGKCICQLSDYQLLTEEPAVWC
jgi:hypothetical protein